MKKNKKKMNRCILDKVKKEEWYKILNISELVYKIIDSDLSQNPVSKLDKDISKQIEKGANSIYKASILIRKELKKDIILNQNKIIEREEQKNV